MEMNASHNEFVDEDFRQWYKTMCRYLADTQETESGSVMSIVRESLDNTKLILVFGQAGTGKSTILEELTGLDLTVAGTLKSGTRKYQICPAVIGGGQYLFLDAAGFGAADINDFEHFGDIMACLFSLDLVMAPTGVIFVFGRAGTRFMEHDLETVRWIECFCGPEFFKNVTIVTSMWDKLTEDDFEEGRKKIDELLGVLDIAQILKPPGQYEGGVMYHHGLPRGKLEGAQYWSVMSKTRFGEQRSNALKTLIRDRYANCEPVKLQVMRDDNNVVSWRDTEAGKVLMARQSEIEIKITDGRAIVCDKTSGLVWMPNVAIEEETYQTREPQRDTDGSWLKTFYRWYEVMMSVSSYFDEARQMRDEGNQQPPAWSYWRSLINWYRFHVQDEN